jgi:hypothetical protein
MVVDDCGSQLACAAMRKEEGKSRRVPERVRGRQLKAKQPGGWHGILDTSCSLPELPVLPGIHDTAFGLVRTSCSCLSGPGQDLRVTAVRHSLAKDFGVGGTSGLHTITIHRGTRRGVRGQKW